MGLNTISQAIIDRLPIGYYNGHLYRIVTDAQKQVKFTLAADNFKPWILIVSRDFYQESLDSLAITNQREVNALLKLNDTDTYTDNIYCVNMVTENQTFYNRWKLEKGLVNAFFVVPEGVLLLKGVAEGSAISIENEQTKTRLYLAASKQGIYSSKPTAVLNSISRFCQSCGLGEQIDHLNITVEQLPMALLRGLRSLPAHQWRVFGRASRQAMTYQDVKVPLLTGLGCVVFYFTLSSGYLYWKNTQLEQQIRDGKTGVMEALNVQDEYVSLQTQLESLSAVAGQLTTKTMIWKILLPLYKDAEFSNIRFQDERYILKGSTVKATELLAKLAKAKGVLDAHFDLPVTSNRSRENFTISFRWQPPKTVNEHEQGGE